MGHSSHPGIPCVSPGFTGAPPWDPTAPLGSHGQRPRAALGNSFFLDLDCKDFRLVSGRFGPLRSASVRFRWDRKKGISARGVVYFTPDNQWNIEFFVTVANFTLKLNSRLNSGDTKSPKLERELNSGMNLQTVTQIHNTRSPDHQKTCVKSMILTFCFL